MRRFKRIRADPEKAADPQAVRMAAVALLAGRDFASSELRDKLESRGYDAQVAAEAVAELVAGGILNDGRYAQNYVEYHADRGQGPIRIAAALKTLGLDEELIDAALDLGTDWPARAREVRIRKFGLSPPESWEERGRQARFLQYRGFSSDDIGAAFGGELDPDGQ